MPSDANQLAVSGVQPLALNDRNSTITPRLHAHDGGIGRWYSESRNDGDPGPEPWPVGLLITVPVLLRQ
jgi:hypothetical protein